MSRTAFLFPGQGAQFVLRLPLDETVSAEAERPASEPVRARRRVLIIEDNVDAADSLRVALELSEHTVEVAYSGTDGVARARELKPEVVLCDIGLPGLDGYQVARALRADGALRDTCLIALSGYALPEDLRRAEQAGFDEHLAKPASLEKLEAKLAACKLRKRAARGEAVTEAIAGDVTRGTSKR